VTFRTRTFIIVLLSITVALGVVVTLLSIRTRQVLLAELETRLLAQARLAAVVLEARALDGDLAAEAESLARLTSARVSLIAPDGTLLADSEVRAADLPSVDNHVTREEVVAATRDGTGVAVRRSQTTNIETMYAAAHVASGPVGTVRTARSLTAIDQELATVWRLALVGLSAGLLVALAVTWVASAVLSRRIQAIATVAERYRQGDFSQPARGDDRDEIGLVARALDQTAGALGQQLAEMARERAHTDAILDGMREGVVLINRAGRLVLTNPAVQTMLRLSDPALDRPYLEVVRDPHITAQLASALEGAPTTPVEVPLDGETRRICVANVVAVSPERGGGAVLVLHDVTDIRRADQVRRDFVANVSHELRTPLTAIRGYVEALSDDTLSEPQRRFVDIIARHTLRMERLVHDLLRLARLDAGQEPLERAHCRVAAVVDSVMHEMHGQLDARQQHVTVEIAPDATHVSADPAKLHDVLRNLVENASHYGPERGTIEVRSARAGDAVTITVADRGPGIPEAELPRVFERFSRVDRSRSRAPGGTGLGLSIVRHLVELHGGKAAARGRDGGGTEVSITLPDPL
jgi:two-component system phosphate regulon sensor histidine kinase PhoR